MDILEEEENDGVEGAGGLVKVGAQQFDTKTALSTSIERRQWRVS